ncbi:MAG: xylulokinase [Pseudomonadota bacterium]
MTIALGIDLGTQSVKALFLDIDSMDVVAIHSAPLALRQDDNGLAEQDVDGWINALHTAVGTADVTLRQRVTAIGVSGQQHGLVALDQNGNALTPVKLWCDTTSAPQCETLMQTLGGVDACIRLTGNPLLPGYTAPKLLHFAMHRPEQYALLDTVLLPHDYLNFYLTGERCMEVGDASGTGFLDVEKRAWSDEMLAAIDPNQDLKQKLPELRIANEAIGSLTSTAATSLGLPAGIPVSIGGGDNMMAAIGTGNLKTGTMTVSLGTSGTVFAHADQPVIDPAGEIAAFCSSSGGWLPLLCTMNCTVASELIRTLLQADIDQLEHSLENSACGADGVITVPYFTGERTPNLPGGKGCIFGLSPSNSTPANIMRSSIEGATFALKQGVDRLQALGLSCRDIVLTGGGANSAAWRRLVADAFNANVIIHEQTESAALGAALQAAQIALSASDISELADAALTIDDLRSCQPDPYAVARYADAYAEYQALASIVTTHYSTPGSVAATGLRT